MYKLSLINFVLATLFCIGAEQASAQFYSRSYERYREEAREERAEEIEKFKRKLKRDRTAMAKGLKQCDIIKGAINSNAEYFILYNINSIDKDINQTVKEMNEQYLSLLEDHIQCILFSPSTSRNSQKGLKRFHSEQRLKIPFIDRYTIDEKAYKYTPNGSKRVYPIYYLYYIADFHYSSGIRVHWRNSDIVIENAESLTEALEAINKHKEERKRH